MVIFVICKLWVPLDSLKLGLKSGILLKTNFLFKITTVSVFFFTIHHEFKDQNIFSSWKLFCENNFLWFQFHKFIRKIFYRVSNYSISI